jgi:hypothetical protein
MPEQPLSDPAPADSTAATPLDDFLTVLNAASEKVEAMTACIAAGPGDLGLRAHQAQWHVRGVIFHCTSLFNAYRSFARGIAGRAQREDPPNAVIMHSPDCQVMMFEFYALVVLARIALDNLRMTLAPVFKTPVSQIPKSVADVVAGHTDCPVYTWLRDETPLDYLSDVRNCLVHYRSFATSDNALVMEEGLAFDEQQQQAVEMLGTLPEVFKATFRLGEGTVAVNVLLPDRIFVRKGTSKALCPFTYNRRINLLSQSRDFAMMVAQATHMSLGLLGSHGEPAFAFSKKQ